MAMMYAYFESISQRKLKRLLANPDAVHDIIWSDLHDGENTGFFELQESWQQLHFLLTGTDWDVDEENPITQVVLGGIEVGPDVFGYGPARFLKPEQVKLIAEALQNADLESYRSARTREEFAEAEIYSFVPENFDETISLLIDYLDGLVEFYGEAKERGDAVVIYIQSDEL